MSHELHKAFIRCIPPDKVGSPLALVALVSGFLYFYTQPAGVGLWLAIGASLAGTAGVFWSLAHEGIKSWAAVKETVRRETER